jgi:hypothetical protein
MKPHMLKTGTNTRMKTKDDKKPNQKRREDNQTLRKKGRIKRKRIFDKKAIKEK